MCYAKLLKKRGMETPCKEAINRAISELGVLIQEKPHSPAAHFWLGLALYNQGNLKEAVFQYRECFDSSPNPPKLTSI